jgi:PAS domain S-box-containing protein
VVTLLLAWTNDAHGLMWSDIKLDSSGLFPTLALTYGAWWYVHVAYSYLMVFLGTLLLLRELVRSSHLYRAQIGALLIAALTPWAGNMLYLLNLGPISHLDLTPFAFTLSGLLLAGAFFRFRLLDIVPVARDTVFESTSDGVILIDAQHRVAGLNPAAQSMLGVPADIVGHPAAQVFAAHPDWVEGYRDVTQVDTEFVRGEGKAQRTYNLHISPLYGRQGHFAGRLITLRDVTERKQAEEERREREQFLAVLNDITRAALEASGLDAMLQTLADRLGKLFAADGCYLTLVNGATQATNLIGRYSPLADDSALHVEPGEAMLTEAVLHAGRPLAIEDVSNTPYLSPRMAALSAARSVLGLPLIAGEQKLGAAVVIFNEPHPFTPEEITRGEQVAAQIALAVDKARLYEQALRDAETKAALLREVNHRVKNSLTAILGLLAIERRHTAEGQSPAYRALVGNLASRIESLAQVHNLLSAAEWQPLPLSDLARQTIDRALQSLPGGEAIAVSVTPSPAQVTPDQAHNLALIINELTTNTLKHAVPGRDRAQITVRITLHDGMIECEFRDDGPGYPPEVLALERQNVGLYLIQNLAYRGLRGEIELHNDRGAVTTIRFKAMK